MDVAVRCRPIESMFLLPKDHIPSSTDALAEAIEEGLRTFICRPNRMVALRGNDSAALDLIAIDLSGAIIEDDRHPRPVDRSSAIPAIAVRNINISGEPIHVLGSDFSFQFEASHVNCTRSFSPRENCCLFCIVHRMATFDSKFLVPQLKT